MTQLTVTYTKQEDVLKMVSALCDVSHTHLIDKLDANQLELVQSIMAAVKTQIIKSVGAIMNLAKQEFQLTFDIDGFIGEMFEHCLRQIVSVEEGAPNGSIKQTKE